MDTPDKRSDSFGFHVDRVYMPHQITSPDLPAAIVDRRQVAVFNLPADIRLGRWVDGADAAFVSGYRDDHMEIVADFWEWRRPADGTGRRLEVGFPDWLGC
jgi:hypothetical protein